MSGFFKLVIYCTYKYFLQFVVCLSFVPFIRQAYERSQYIQVSTQPLTKSYTLKCNVTQIFYMIENYKH